MTKKKISKCIAAFVLLFLVACSGSQKDQGADVSSTTYTCPMHPQVISEHPGTCPICAMDLVPVSASGNGNEIMLSASQMQLANIKTRPIRNDVFQSSKVLNGRILFNPQSTTMISSKYAGRVEEVFFKETGKPVRKGQPLFRIYSEELQALQQEYLLQASQMAAFPGEKIYQTLYAAAENRLRLLGFGEAQMRSLRSQRKVAPSVVVYSPGSGVISELNILEGQYVSEGTPVMRLENLNQLWLEADVYPDEAKSLRLNMPMMVSVNGQAGGEHEVRIDFISPQVDPSSQIIKIRGTIRNSGNLQPGMQASILLPAMEKVEGISLPLDAIVRGEGGAHVWIKTGKSTFEPRKVVTGDEDAVQIIVRSGLENVKEVVTSGAYLLTSEFILKKGRNPIAEHHH
ncbi:MAG: efflux RND transporter periplasmic adaptor subunit [Arcticibacter sp.]